MATCTQVLWDLAKELVDSAELNQLRSLTKAHLPDYDQLIMFDKSLGGPSMTSINCDNLGRYDVADRDVFRPLQYCGMYFRNGFQTSNIEWFSRHIVHMSSLHIESLIKRIGKVWRFPLGKALRESRVKRKVDQVTWSQIDRFTRVYNDSKHNVNHPKDTHLFSIQDAIVAYIVSRKLGFVLYPLAKLTTDLDIFNQDCK